MKKKFYNLGTRSHGFNFVPPVFVNINRGPVSI